MFPMFLSTLKHDVPQYAHFLPKYFPKYGTMTIVSNNSSCCNDSLHSLSASETYSSSSAEEAVAEDGSESMSSASEELVGGSMKLSLMLMDMTGERRRREVATSDSYWRATVETWMTVNAMPARIPEQARLVMAMGKLRTNERWWGSAGAST